MLSATLFVSALALSAAAYPRPANDNLVGTSTNAQALLVNTGRAFRFRDPVCVQIEKATSPLTAVFYPGDRPYEQDISHWASSSTQRAQCSVRPDTAEDVAIILGIVGTTRTPFAVKGGGHATNPGFSSTTGVHISMVQFAEVTYDPSSQTVAVGSGLLWDEVYAALAPYDVNVVGGRMTGVGVAGFTLGGGYSWLTNQHGLTIDTVVEYELVKPTGDIVTVTKASDPELFFGLKGGMNNFGIVTRFTFKAFPQGQVWGGVILFNAQDIPAVTKATGAFSALSTDPKAAMIVTYTVIAGEPGVELTLFYDGPSPPAGTFDDFLVIPYATKDVSTRDFLTLVQSSPSDDTYGMRGVFHGIPITQYTPGILAAIANETTFWSSHLSVFSGSYIDYGVQPFLPTLFSHGVQGSSAYPASRTKSARPFHLYFAWSDERFDAVFHEVARQSAARIKAVALAEGQDVADAAIYPNYAIFDTPVEGLYGDNVEPLRALKAAVDPMNVMGLAGGFKL
ncbi:hypothetical protein C0991_001309 [Blastosporella zonata]|nr:hypothetical protein C0991_001309 [Blastosporella zonata]